MPETYAEVALDQKGLSLLDYSVPEELVQYARIGMRVLVPFRKKEVKGTIVKIKHESPFKELRPLLKLLSSQSKMNESQWNLANWISSYYATPIEKVVKLFIPSAVRKDVKQKKKEDLLIEAEFFLGKPKILTDEQKSCLEHIEHSLKQNTFSSHLIHGITGSGKTEIYLQAIGIARSLGKSALFLVPEISLTSQTIERFRSRFSEKIAVLHHKRSFGERNDAWQKLASGEIQIAIGARSLIFAPMPKLGLIIVDEEHDASYKQTEEAPCYHARNVAVKRAHLENATILLGSATPSIESRYNAEIGKYQLHTLVKRANLAALPTVRIVDMQKVMERNKGFTHFSDELLRAIEDRLKKGEQTLLFLNKRGYYRQQICLECRNSIKCPHCDLNLTFHKEIHELQCHLCDFKRKPPQLCPTCNSPKTLEFKGFGTEHVQKSLYAIFPHVRTLRMDRDTTKKKESHEEIFKEFRAHKADVLIGTQMVAKGFHFPSVTLVGILNSDATLQIPDFRSSESLFQLLTQVAGRAGRAELNGEVILQTFLPNHPVIKLSALQDYPTFYEKEIEERKLFQYPPFTQLIKCLAVSLDEEKAKLALSQIFEKLISLNLPNTQIFPPAPSGHPKIKDLYRYQFLIKTTNRKLSEQIRSVISFFEFKEVYIKLDIDPISIFF